MELNMQTAMVYLVDDDPDIRDSLSLWVESIGLKIKTFPSAEEFLNQYSPDQPACLILDVVMPLMSGLELQEELASRNIEIPIIFISGNAKVADSSKAFRAGAVDFIEKPYDLKLLMSRINEALKNEIQYRNQQLAAEQNQVFFDCLTPREKQVLQLIVHNNSSKEAAYILAISNRTVEAHRARIMSKLQAKSITELVAMVYEHGLNIDVEPAKLADVSALTTNRLGIADLNAPKEVSRLISQA